MKIIWNFRSLKKKKDLYFLLAQAPWASYRVSGRRLSLCRMRERVPGPARVLWEWKEITEVHGALSVELNPWALKRAKVDGLQCMRQNKKTSKVRQAWRHHRLGGFGDPGEIHWLRAWSYKVDSLFSCIAGGFFTIWATREVQEYWSG